VSANIISSGDTTVVQLADRSRTLPAQPGTVGTIRLGGEPGPAVEKLRDATFRRPAWVRFGRASLAAARTAATGAGATVRRVRRYQTAGSVTDQIRDLELLVAITADPAERKALRSEITDLEVARQQLAAARHREHATIGGLAGGGAAVLTLVVLTVMVGLVVPGAAVGAGAGAAWWAGRREQRRQGELEAAVQRAAIEVGAPAVEVAETPQSTAVPVTGSADLINALIKARVIDAGERDETHVVGALRADGPGWGATIELPGGKTAEEAVTKLPEIASALRAKRGQLELHADTSDGGHEGRFTIWMANDANPWNRPPAPSLLIDAPSWNFWRDGVPLGADAREARQILRLLWSSMLIGGLQDYGKSYLARVIAAAAALDPRVKIVLITGKPGPDWAPLKQIAHHYVAGATPEKLAQVQRVMDDSIADMQGRGDALERLYEEDPKLCPQGKLTEELAGRPGMEMTLVIVDELQELLDAAANMKVRVGDEDGDGGRARSGKDLLVETFARFSRVARYVGGMGLYITQRPDASSVPTQLRGVCSKRASARVKGATSARMVLGDEAVASGAAPHMLVESHKGVFVIDSGAEEGHLTLRGDMINLPEFKDICARGRQLRHDAGTLTGYAAGQQREVGGLVGLLLRVFAAAGNPEHLTTAEIVSGLAELQPDPWAAIATGDRRQAGARLGKALAAELDGAACSLAPVERSWGRGYLLADVRAAAGIAPK
jgi:hypothetical protein